MNTPDGGTYTQLTSYMQRALERDDSTHKEKGVLTSRLQIVVDTLYKYMNS